ncbi:MAG: hypothetical protein Q9195_008607 [Heterodermia aff. obscurata]
MPDENTPLLDNLDGADHHEHFCLITGIPPYHKHSPSSQVSDCIPLYARAVRKRRAQNFTYNFTSALSNTLLLTQVILGALLTALGAMAASYRLITIFGVANTIIAGLVAYLKSRGQPMRSRMFRDDLEEVVDEIEDSRAMWMAIKHGVHGYDEIDVDDKVSVRSEVARLTKMYEDACKKYAESNPDMHGKGPGKAERQGFRPRPVVANAGAAPAPAPADNVDVSKDDGKGKSLNETSEV